LFSWWPRVTTILLNFRPIRRYSPESQIRRFRSEILPTDKSNDSRDILKTLA
jgi:hypothetical protein